jgi:hypothetical protein
MSCQLLEERKDLLILLDRGKVEVVPKSPYTLLKHKFFGGVTIRYNTGQLELQEVENGFKFSLSDRIAFIPDRDRAAEAILAHRETGDEEKLLSLWRLHYALSLLQVSVIEGHRVDLGADGKLWLPRGVEVSVAEWLRYHDGSLVAKFLFEQTEGRAMFRGSTHAVALGGRDETGQVWLHFLHPDYASRSIAECELWLAGAQPGDEIIF